MKRQQKGKQASITSFFGSTAASRKSSALAADKENVPPPGVLASRQASSTTSAASEPVSSGILKPSAFPARKPLGIFGSSAPVKRAASEDSITAKRPRLQMEARPTKRPSGVASRSSSTGDGKTAAHGPKFQLHAFLTAEQRSVLDAVINKGENVFFTGAAGTGKSHLLKQIVGKLSELYGPTSPRFAVTATTGLAAFNIGGKTLHKWAGIGIGSASAEQIATKILKSNMPSSREAKLNWTRARVLIIDEVSMLSAELFDKLEELARRVRKNSEPFGGIQVVLTGDFFQLPPISRGPPATLCFEAKSWPAVMARSVLLSQVFRQSDARLVTMLNAMRSGEINDHVETQFRALARPITYDDGLEPTELFARREDVDRANAARMAALDGPEFVFKAEDSPMNDFLRKQYEQLLAAEILRLKVGAQVMLIYNLDETLVNGRRGYVQTFCSPKHWDYLAAVFQSTPRSIAVFNALLKTGGAVTAILDAELEELGLDFPARAKLIKAAAADRRDMVPVVDFRQGALVPILPREFKVDGGGAQAFMSGGSGGASDAARKQLPLLPSWALSIHKAQGQTIDRVKVDLRRVFERGQAYVAVSRATSYERLQVIGFRRDCVKVDPRVCEFYRKLDAETRELTGSRRP